MTYREALMKLPNEYIEKALRNTQNDNRISLDDYFDENILPSIHKNFVSFALGKSFTGSISPEGREYWQKIFNKINYENYNV